MGIKIGLSPKLNNDICVFGLRATNIVFLSILINGSFFPSSEDKSIREYTLGPVINTTKSGLLSLGSSMNFDTSRSVYSSLLIPVVGAIYGLPQSDLMTCASSPALILAVTAMFRFERDNPLFLAKLIS